MFNSVTSWFKEEETNASSTGATGDKEAKCTDESRKVEIQDVNKPEKTDATTDEDSHPPGIQEQLDEVSTKAYDVAKEWGG